MQHPQGTSPDKRHEPDKLHEPAELKGLYRLVDEDQVTPASVLAPHRARVRQRIEDCGGRVLLLHDSTELDCTGKTTLSDLGYVGKGPRSGGISVTTLWPWSRARGRCWDSSVRFCTADRPRRGTRRAGSVVKRWIASRGSGRSGHQNCKHDHPPGWLVLWRGWTKLESTMLGVLAVERARCG